MAGLETVGRDTFGVFPLRGKLLNVRDANIKQIRNNAEVVNLFQILGLDMGKSYGNLSVPLSEQGLRYGRVMIMADQDYDGSHIKGLVLNLFHYFFPNLLARPGFLSEFITPMLKARRGKEEKVFFGMEEFRAWHKKEEENRREGGSRDDDEKDRQNHNKKKPRKWAIKYYKGLGTSTAQEAKEYFGELDKHHIFFRSQEAQESSSFVQWKKANCVEEGSYEDTAIDGGDGKDVLGGDGHFIDMAFNKKRSEDRRSWILNSDHEGDGSGGVNGHFTSDLDPFLDVSSVDIDGVVLEEFVKEDPRGEKRVFAQWLDAERARLSKDEESNDDGKKNLAADSSLMRQFYTYRDFINKELILFSNMDNMRSIPSTIDGLKPSQRKVLFACFKRKLTAEIKVAQLAGYVSEHTAYHHGEQSLHSTIISMAQDFVGSNNIPLLAPSGQFGTRLQGGKDAASARYIFTQLSEAARLLFPEDDDAVLNYLVEDGQPIEPDFYVPILPVLLINGSDGIGTGWSTSVPRYNPRDLIENARIFCREMEQETGSMLESESGSDEWVDKTDIDKKLLESKFLRDPDLSVLREMVPWTHGWRGIVEPTFSGNADANKEKRIWKSKGLVENIQIHSQSSATFEITELPLGRWTDDMKATLNDLSENQLIKRYEEHHTERSVHFIVHCGKPTVEALKSARARIKKKNSKKKKKNRASTEELESEMQAAFSGIIWDTVALKLETNINETNIHSFDRNHRIRKSEDPREVVAQHAQVRMDMYGKRKEQQLRDMRKELRKLRNRARFAAEMAESEKGIDRADGTEGETVRLRNRILGKPKSVLAAEMFAAGFDTEKMLEEEEEVEQGRGKEPSPSVVTVKDFEYLLKTALWNFTQESVEQLQQQKVDREGDLKKLAGTSLVELWRQDLKSMEDHLDASYQDVA